MPTLSESVHSVNEKPTLVHRFSRRVCFGKTSNIGIAIYAPIDFLLCLAIFLCLVSLIPYKFLGESEAVKFDLYNVTRSFKTGRSSKNKVPDHLTYEKFRIHARNVMERCGLPYIANYTKAEKSSQSHSWLSFAIFGQAVFLLGSLPLFRVRGGDINHSYEGKQFCIIFFILQPVAAGFMFGGLYELYADPLLCEFELLLGTCCSRLQMFYAFLISICIYKFHEILVVSLYYIDAGQELQRRELIRKKVAQTTIIIGNNIPVNNDASIKMSIPHNRNPSIQSKAPPPIPRPSVYK